MRDTEF